MPVADIDAFPSREPNASFVVEIDEELQRLMRLLPSDTLRRVATWKLEGWSNDEVSETLGVSVRTVERKLTLIRARWQEMAEREL